MTKLPELGNQRKWARNAQLARHFNVSAMTVWRWKHAPELGCPPSYVVNGLEWNDLDLWDAWMRSRVVGVIDEDSRTHRHQARFKGRSRSKASA